MTAAEIQNAIANNNRQIVQNQNYIRQAQRQIEQLSDLSDALTRRRNDFAEEQDDIKNKLMRNSGFGARIKAFNSYYNGMISLVTGNEANSVYDGLYTAKSKVESKIDELEEAIRKCNNNIRVLNQRNSQLRAALANMSNS